jgi:Tol biopolymer transport system component
LIAFFSNRTGNNDIYIVDSATGEIKQTAATPGDERWPTWSK